MVEYSRPTVCCWSFNLRVKAGCETLQIAVFILGIYMEEYSPKKSYIPQNLSSFFVYLGLEYPLLQKANNKTVV